MFLPKRRCKRIWRIELEMLLKNERNSIIKILFDFYSWSRGNRNSFNELAQNQYSSWKNVKKQQNSALLYHSVRQNRNDLSFLVIFLFQKYNSTECLVFNRHFKILFSKIFVVWWRVLINIISFKKIGIIFQRYKIILFR